MNEESYKVLENPKRNKYATLTVFTPNCNLDTFMSCISYWVYGKTSKRKFVRKQILLFFAKQCFYEKFKSIDEIIKMHFQNKLNFNDANPYVVSFKDAINFISANSAPRVVTSIDIMTHITADFLKVCIHLDRGKHTRTVTFGTPNNNKLTIWLKYDSTTKTCSLKHWKGLGFVASKTMYELRVSKVENEMIYVCDFNRNNQIHTCEIKEFDSKWIYTIFPTNGYKQMKTKCYIYVQNGGTNKAKCVAESPKTTNNNNIVMNPYFFIDADMESFPSVSIHIVQAQSQKDADKLLKYKNKLKILY